MNLTDRQDQLTATGPMPGRMRTGVRRHARSPVGVSARIPDDVRAATRRSPETGFAFFALAPRPRREHIRVIEGEKHLESRERRIARAIKTLTRRTRSRSR